MPPTPNEKEFLPPRHAPELPEILLVEDEPTPRKELKRVLVRKGFKVREASNYSEAIHEAGSSEVGVVLMDLILGDGPDGIEAARGIQQSNPDTSVIFVSAYASDPIYRQRAQRDVIHIGGWVEKPIEIPRIPEFVEMISSELVKVRLRALLKASRILDPAPYLRMIAEQDHTVTPEIVAEVLKELASRTSTALPPMESRMTLNASIDAVYDEMRALIAAQAGRPGLREALRPLREKLRRLQEREADEIEQRFHSHFRFDYDEGEQLIKQARQILRKR